MQIYYCSVCFPAPPETKAMTAALIIPTLNIFLQVLLCHWNI
jgi:hypothetical protein